MTHRELVEKFVRRASMLGMDPSQRTEAKRVNQHADALASQLRRARAEYERYLYQALGRKVDFEEVEVSKSTASHYTVTAKYIVLRNNTEPMAPRFWLAVTVSVDHGVPERPLKQEVNAGFTNAIGMSHSKFTQGDCDEQMLIDPTRTFGWIEYLEGDFLRGKRLVRPFTPGSPGMGTRTSSRPLPQTGYTLTGEAVALSRRCALNRGFNAGALSFFHTGFVRTLINYLDHLKYYDEASLFREAMVHALQRDGERGHLPYIKIVPHLQDLYGAANVFDAVLESDTTEDIPPCVIYTLHKVSSLLHALNETAAAEKIRRAAGMIPGYETPTLLMVDE